MNREFERWREMIAAVDDPSEPKWQWHGKHGVTLDPRWRKFECFIEDLGLMPGHNSKLDRLTGTDCFSAKSTSWRKSADLVLTLNGNSYSVSEWSNKLGLPKGTISSRIRKNLPIEMVLRKGELYNKSLIGRRFGHLEVVRFDSKMTRGDFWRCKCDCGNCVSVAAEVLQTLKVKSCGCVSSNLVKLCPDFLLYNGKTKHIRVWAYLRGIPSGKIAASIRAGHTVAQALGYEATPARNKGVSELAIQSGVSPSTIRHRMALGVPPAELTSTAALTVGKLYEYDGLTMTLPQWAVYLEVNEATLRGRLHLGWSFEDAVTLPVKDK